MRISILLIIILAVAPGAFAQFESKPEATFEILLQTVSGTPNGRVEVGPALESAVKKLRNTYDLSGFRVDASYLQRASNSMEYKGVVTASVGSPKFTEWSIKNLRRSAEDRGVVYVEGFRYGSRIPLAFDQTKSEAAKTAFGVAYEWIGISSTRFKLAEGEPTLVGTLGGERSGEMIFLFLTATAVP